jgi:lysyl-tRNA synthetase, class II
VSARGKGRPARADRGAAGAREQRARRLAKLEGLRARGIDPYPVTFPRTATLAEVGERFGGLAAGEGSGERVGVAGRLMRIRRQGGVVFAVVHDESGDLQLMASRDVLGEQGFRDVLDLDLGDWVGVGGEVVRTRRGELSVAVATCRLLGKALRPVPLKSRSLGDPETRLRQRYLDLVVNPDARRVADVRTRTLAALRTLLAERGYVEVETPVLQPEAGGAAARPFITHHNALDVDQYLRIALELHLKRLIVGGYERVFEIGRVFRNEGLDTRHNPEFTMLEAYRALADYRDMMTLTEELVAGAARAAIGRTEITVEGRTIDLAPPWRRATMVELIRERTGAEIRASMPVEEARSVADGLGVEWEPGWGSGRIVDEVYDAHVEEHLAGPVFVMDHPREVSPLARAHRDDPTLVERFEVVINGRELANAYSELTDPIDQRERFEAEARLKAAGDPEAGDVDEDYLRAMELGMPPTGGLGIGVDRLVMLLAEVSSIREVILFPTLRPEGGAHPGAARERAAAGPPAPEPAPVEEPLPEERPQAPLRLPAAEPCRRGRAAVLAALVALAGVACLLPRIPGLHSRVAPLDDALLPEGVRSAGAVVSVLLGLLLVLLAIQLARRKRAAWWGAVILLGVATVDHVLKGPHALATLLTAAVLIALVYWRDEFRAAPDPPSLWAAIRFVPLWLAAVLIYGASALLIERNHLSPSLSVGGVLETAFGGLVGLDGPYTYQRSLFARFFPDSLVALGVAGIVILAYLVFRPLAERRTVSAVERRRAERLVHEWGWDTLAYFALRDDKSLFFSSDGRAMIAYAYLHGHALASGDPIGPPDAIGPVVDEFLAHCRERAWRPAFLAVREADAPLYRERGLRSLYLGDEAIIRCPDLTLRGPGMKKVRQAVTRVSRDHRFALIPESEAGPELVAELNAISQRWRGKAPERGFTMSLSQDVSGEREEILLAVARGPDGAAAGFLRLVPAFGEEPGYSLDLMRRDPGAPNGMTEFLIARTAEALAERGVVRLSMNFATWGRLFEAAEGRVRRRDRVLRWVVSRLNPFFQIQSLHDFNAKFHPEWLPRVLIYEDAADLPRVGLLYAGVEGFLNVPVLGPLLVPRVVAVSGPA